MAGSIGGIVCGSLCCLLMVVVLIGVVVTLMKKKGQSASAEEPASPPAPAPAPPIATAAPAMAEPYPTEDPSGSPTTVQRPGARPVPQGNRELPPPPQKTANVGPIKQLNPGATLIPDDDWNPDQIEGGDSDATVLVPRGPRRS